MSMSVEESRWSRPPGLRQFYSDATRTSYQTDGLKFKVQLKPVDVQ
jgi:hypothetical protein